MAMRIHLRNTSTGLLFQEPDRWTHEVAKAQAFRHSAEAMDLARRQGLEQVEVLLRFEESQASVGLALPPRAT